MQEERCKECLKTDLVQIGEPKDASIKGINDSTIYTFYQCKKCGSVWIEIRESGAGGHGHFFNNLTESYY